MMQYRHLHYFVSVVEAGSFSRAASTIHVAQPALSQQIAQLEEQPGVSLLLRSARGVRPTAAGEVLYREASAILRTVAAAPRHRALRHRDREGHRAARACRRPSWRPRPWPSWSNARTSLPDVVVRMAVSDSPTLMRRVTEHELDLGLVLEDEFVPAFARTPLFRQRLFLVRHRAASNSKPVQLADLASLPLVLPSSPNITRTALDRALAAAKLSPNVVMEADVVANIIAAVRAGAGGAVLPKGDLVGHVRRRPRRARGDRAAGLSHLLHHLVRQLFPDQRSGGGADPADRVCRDHFASNTGTRVEWIDTGERRQRASAWEIRPDAPRHGVARMP